MDTTMFSFQQQEKLEKSCWHVFRRTEDSIATGMRQNPENNDVPLQTWKREVKATKVEKMGVILGRSQWPTPVFWPQTDTTVTESHK